MRLLTGGDNVHTWSESIWDTILDGVRIVVSTYQVLLDALSHGFIGMDRLSLIVFDEGTSDCQHNALANQYSTQLRAQTPRKQNHDRLLSPEPK